MKSSVFANARVAGWFGKGVCKYSVNVSLPPLIDEILICMLFNMSNS